MPIEFKVPELGENVHAATIAKIFVQKGSRITPQQAVVELETDKASMEVPCEQGGTVEQLLVKEGEEVQVGQTLFTFRVDPSTTPEAADKPTVEKRPAPSVELKSGASVPAAPAVRRLARESGVEIGSVRGSGPEGRIGMDDVKAHARASHTAARSPTAGEVDTAAPTLPDFARWGGIERKPMSRVRRLTGERMTYAWSVIPHVTQFGKADVTEVERLRLQAKDTAVQAGGRLSLVAILLKTAAGALKEFPQFNASVDRDRREIVYKKYVHIGVAMDTERGLLVPVIRDVDRKNVSQLSADLKSLQTKAQEGKITVEEMSGGCFTISNIGALGGGLFTPIVNWPEVAILGMARTQTEARFEDGTFKPRLMLPLALSFDHRAVDGADGARFMRWIVESLEKTVRLAADG